MLSRQKKEDEPGLTEAAPSPAPGSSPPVTAVPPPTREADIERLRDILFGAQARTTDVRLGNLENRLETIRQELIDLIENRSNSNAQSATSQVTAVRKELSESIEHKTEAQSAQLRAIHQELTERLDKQSTDFTTQLRTVERDLSARLDSQQTDQMAQLRDLQRDMQQRLETLNADLLSQMRQMRKELSDRLAEIDEAHTTQNRTLRQDTKQRDDELRHELAMLATLLDNKKVSRQDLGHMLADLGQRLRQEMD
jgi:hypothetical protein